MTDDEEKEYKRRIAVSEDGMVEAIGKELLEVRLRVDGRKYHSMPIRDNCVKVVSWNDVFVQTEWDRGTFRLWTRGSAFRINFCITDRARW